MSKINRCILCQSSSPKRIFYQGRVSVCVNAPITRKDFATEETAPLDIVMCHSCSHIFNRCADERIIQRMYKKNYSSGIPVSQDSINNLHLIAQDAVDIRRFRGQLVVEIGASDFAFSKIMLRNGIRKLIAFEPSDIFITKEPRIIHLKEYFSTEKFPDAYRGKVGLFIIRHVLEHVNFPSKMLQDITDLMPIGASLYIEVPNVDNILSQKRVYDFFYEHVSYFSPALLKNILKRYGFQIIRQVSLKEGQHFGLLCKKVVRYVPGIASVKIYQPITTSRARRLKQLISHRLTIKKALARIVKPHKRIAIYGAGNHGIAVSLLMKPDLDKVEYIFDLNPLKAGFYSPLSHLLIKPPFLGMDSEIEAIIIAASLHEQEIHRMLREKYRFQGEIYGTRCGIQKLK